MTRDEMIAAIDSMMAHGACAALLLQHGDGGVFEELDALSKRGAEAIAALRAPAVTGEADRVLTPEQAKALNRMVTHIEDGVAGAADSVGSLASSDHIGWSESCELGAHASTLRDLHKTMLADYQILYPLLKAYEDAGGEL